MNKLLTLILIISSLLISQTSNAFVLTNANTLGFNNTNMALSGLYSTNRVTTYVPKIISTNLTNYAYGFVFHYGLLDNLDVMIGLGNVGYEITPDIAGLLRMEGGTLFGTGIKYGILKEDENIPVSLAFLFQYTTVPADLIDSGIKLSGCNQDTYYKLIISKNFYVFFPYIAIGIDSRFLRIGSSRSQSTISQIDIGYGTALSENLVLGVELNWSGTWNDPVMDDIFAAETLSEALGVSFGVLYLY